MNLYKINYVDNSCEFCVAEDAVDALSVSRRADNSVTTNQVQFICNVKDISGFEMSDDARYQKLKKLLASVIDHILSD